MNKFKMNKSVLIVFLAFMLLNQQNKLFSMNDIDHFIKEIEKYLKKVDIEQKEIEKHQKKNEQDRIKLINLLNQFSEKNPRARRSSRTRIHKKRLKPSKLRKISNIN